MYKRLLVLVFALVFFVGMAGVGVAAEKCKGKISEINTETSEITVKCKKGEPQTVKVEDCGEYKAGDMVQVTDGKVKKMPAKKLEGC